MKLISFNTLGLALVIIGFAVSLGRVLIVSGVGTDRGNRELVIAHWNLEPGFREALQEAIDGYMALPHVKDSGLTIVQSAVTERYYAQWLNTHLVAGTAPDISKRGMAELTSGSNTARFFEPLGTFVVEPNPYNAPDYLPDDMGPDLAAFLAERPWRDTFIDNMEGGYIDNLHDYYAVPLSYSSSIKLYFNRSMLRVVKDYVVEAFALDARPEWLDRAIREGFVVPSVDLQAWLSSDDTPRTLGQLVLICDGSAAWAEETGRHKFSPIAGSSYMQWSFARRYIVPFTSNYGPLIDQNGDGSLATAEVAAAVDAGVFSLRDERLQAFHELVRKITEYFPPGFLALDRERANNRFVSGHAMVIASGGWDANSLLIGAANPSGIEPFEIVIADFPLPGSAEKWGELVTGKASEAGREAGSPFQVYQRSKHKGAAVDLLRFLTSFTVNERFNREANWLPVIRGTEPEAAIAAFAVDTSGISPRMKADFNDLQGFVASRYRGAFSLYALGDISYLTMIEMVEEALDRPRVGLDDVWARAMVTERDGNRNVERLIASNDVRSLLMGNSQAANSRPGLITLSVLQQNGQEPRALWSKLNPGKPFPDP